MSAWTSYKPSGEIHCVFVGSEPIAEELEGLEYIAGEGSYFTQYVDVTQTPPILADRVAIPFIQNKTTIDANGIDECDISGLPDPCTVEWPDGQVDEVIGGSIQFSVDYPGTYIIKLSTGIHLETEVTIEAVAPS